MRETTTSYFSSPAFSTAYPNLFKVGNTSTKMETSISSAKFALMYAQRVLAAIPIFFATHAMLQPILFSYSSSGTQAYLATASQASTRQTFCENVNFTERSQISF